MQNKSAAPLINYGTPAPTTQTPTPSQSAAIVRAAQSSSLGMILVANNGMTLYRFTKDAAGVSNCTGQCATLWPPFVLTANQALTAGTGVSGTLATITRADGSSQLTYNGQPLYYWSGDTKPGDTNGQNFNGVWFVVNP